MEKLLRTKRAQRWSLGYSNLDEAPIALSNLRQGCGLLVSASQNYLALFDVVSRKKEKTAKYSLLEPISKFTVSQLLR